MDLHVGGTCNIGFLGMEGQADRYQPRIQEVVTLYGEDWLSRFHLRAPGFGGRSTWDMAGDPEVRAQIQEFIEHYQLKVLYADPFTHTKTGTLKEESPSDMTVVLEAFAEIRDATGCAIVLLHHPPYGRIAGRGSTVLHNVLDAEISLEGQGAIEEWSRPGGKVKMIWTKPDRDGLTPAPKMLVRRNNGSLALSDESCDTAGVDQDWTRIETILGLHGGMTFPELKKKIADAGFAKSDTTLRRIVETMASNRRIQYFSKQGATGYVQPIGISTSPNLSMDTSPTGEVDITQDNPIC